MADGRPRNWRLGRGFVANQKHRGGPDRLRDSVGRGVEFAVGAGLGRRGIGAALMESLQKFWDGVANRRFSEVGFREFLASTGAQRDVHVEFEVEAKLRFHVLQSQLAKQSQQKLVKHGIPASFVRRPTR